MTIIQQFCVVFCRALLIVVTYSLPIYVPVFNINQITNYLYSQLLLKSPTKVFLVAFYKLQQARRTVNSRILPTSETFKNYNSHFYDFLIYNNAEQILLKLPIQYS